VIIFLPVFLLLLIVFQTTVTDTLFFGKVGVEISLILVIYAGFHLKVIKGLLLSFILGFLLDCIVGSISGLFTFLYTLLFFISTLISLKVYPERASFIMGFTFLCALLQQMLILLFNRLIYGADLFYDAAKVFLPQAILAGILSPAFFNIFSRLGVLLNGENARSIKRTT